MKKTSLFSLLLVALTTLAVGCSSGPEKKVIKPAKAEFSSGKGWGVSLSEMIEVDAKESELTMATQDGEKEGQVFILKVHVKVTSDVLKGEKPGSIELCPARDEDDEDREALLMVNLEDENGVYIQRLYLKDTEEQTLRKLLSQGKGASGELIFQATFDDPDDAPDWFDKTTQFVPYLAADVCYDFVRKVTDDTFLNNEDEDVDSVMTSIEAETEAEMKRLEAETEAEMKRLEAETEAEMKKLEEKYNSSIW